MLRKEILGTKIKTQSGLSKPITIAQPKDDSDYKSENFLDTDILLAKDIKQFVKGQEIDTSNFLKYKDRNGTAIYLDNKEYAINGYPLIPAYNADYSSHGDLRTCNFTIGSRTFQHKVGGSDQSISFLTDNNYKMQLSEYGWTYHIGFDFDDTKRNDQITIDNNGITMNTYDPTNIGLYITTSGGTNQLKLDSDGGSLIRGDRKLNFSSSTLKFVDGKEDTCSIDFDGQVLCKNVCIADSPGFPHHGTETYISPSSIKLKTDGRSVDFISYDKDEHVFVLCTNYIRGPLGTIKVDSDLVSTYGIVAGERHALSEQSNNISITNDAIRFDVGEDGDTSGTFLEKVDEENSVVYNVNVDNLSAHNDTLNITGNTKITGTLETTGRINATGGITVSNGITEYGNFSFGDGRIRGSVSIAKINKSNDKYLTCADTAQQSSTKVYTTDGGIQETVLKSDYDALVARVAALEAKLTQ